MVSNSALAALCVHSGLSECLIYESSHLKTEISSYKEKLNEARMKENEIAAQESRIMGQYWVDIEPPKVCLRYLYFSITKTLTFRLFLMWSNQFLEHFWFLMILILKGLKSCLIH